MNRYYLIACGTSNYKNLDDSQQLASIETDIRKIVNLFTKNFGYKQVLLDLRLNPKGNDLTNQFADWLKHEDRQDTDIIIFYYSGHGEYLQGDRHYLWLEDTDPQKIGQTALATEDLVRPLNNEGVKISQILYIIDTCYSQSGAGDVTSFASKVIQQYLPIKGANIAVYTIAACRAKQTATEGVFSQALEEILGNWETDEFERYIHPSRLVEKINSKLSSATQQVKYSVAGAETSPNFFPILPKNLRTWEEKCDDFIQKLFGILTKKLDASLFFINSFLLSSKFIETFVLDNIDLKEKLKYLAIKPVSEKICPFIACSEWCRLKFLDRNPGGEYYAPNLASQIENWQLEVIKSRTGADLNKIKDFVKNSFDRFEKLISEGNLRIQIEIEPELDRNTNTGLQTGSFLLNMNLWIEDRDLPLGRFAEQLRLEPKNSNETLLTCLKQDDLLPKLIRKARYSLPKPVKLTIEIFLPFDRYQESLENICFLRGRKREPLGKEYPIFINSFERYFDRDFREIRDEIYAKKKAIWNDDDDRSLDSEIYYIGTKPSEEDLETIQEDKAIALWSRNASKPLVEGEEGQIKISEWKEWPEQIRALRKQENDPEITLFWDDLYPKPSERCRPLNTKVVE